MKITLLPGDGIGVEIVDAAVEVLDAAAEKYTGEKLIIMESERLYQVQKEDLPKLENLLIILCVILSTASR